MSGWNQSHSHDMERPSKTQASTWWVHTNQDDCWWAAGPGPRHKASTRETKEKPALEGRQGTPLFPVWGCRR